MNWLITGGCGFIGRNLIASLQKEGGHYIRIVDNLSVGSKDDLAEVCTFEEVDPGNIAPKGAVDLIVGDILDEKLALDSADNFDVIVHLAANTGVASSVEDPRFDCTTNVIGTLNYLESARQKDVRRFVFASSGAPAGECEPPIHEELPPHPVSPYGASKLAGEGYCSAYYRTFGVQTVALRFSNVYGPWSTRKSSVVAKFIRNIVNGDDLVIYGDGSQTRDFIYIDDLVGAIKAAASITGIGGETFQIATSRETTIDEVAENLIKIFKDRGFPQKIKRRYTNSRKGDVRKNYSDTTKALDLLNWKANVDLKNGLETTVDWFRHHSELHLSL